MKLCTSISTAILTGLFCSSAFCSRERLIPTHKVSIWAKAEKPFGEVSATIETTPSLHNPRIKSIVLTVAGRKYIVPPANFKNLQYPLLRTAEFRTETGIRDGGPPWLYLTLRLDMPNIKSATDYQQFYITFRNGKLRETFTYPTQP